MRIDTCIALQSEVKERGEHLSGNNVELGAQVLDLRITLGGDGTVLHLASLFKQDEPLPPCIAFAMGILGAAFLCLLPPQWYPDTSISWKRVGGGITLYDTYAWKTLS